MSLATPIPLQRLCKLALVHRAGYYRWREAAADADPQTDRDLDLRDEIQRIALEYPSYGWPRITAELKRRGWKANHKARLPDHAGGQPAVLAWSEILRGHHGLQPYPTCVPEHGFGDGSQGH